jgi:hypothetical protein
LVVLVTLTLKEREAGVEAREGRLGMREADIEERMVEVAVGEEALRKDRSVLKGRLMELKERRAREEERCKEGREGVEKEIALRREKVEGMEMLKNALRGGELGVESMERDVSRREKDVEGAQERLRGSEDVVEGKERSIIVMIEVVRGTLGSRSWG